MLRISFLFCFSILLPTLANASAMSSEKSRCYGMEMSAQRYNDWKQDFEKFLSDYDLLNEKARYEVLRSALTKVIKLTEDFSSKSGVRTPVNLVTQSEQLLADMKSGYIPPRSAIKVMKSGLMKIEDKMDEMIFIAQAKSPNCEIAPDKVYTNGIDSSTVVR